MGSRHNSRRKQQSKEAKSKGNQKYAVDERVLCYEPDQKKARVLYDSKVLEVVERKNHGKTKVEYKIHFFGWNSSWDRYVDEECVLKDTDENRTLQKELKERADSLLQTHLKKRKRKKTLSELLKEATKDKGGKNVNPSHSKTKADEDSSRSHSNSESSDQETSDDDDDGEVSRIIVTNHMKSMLERDCYNITVKKMLVRIPVDISVICIFEAYVKDLGFRELRHVLEQREAYLKSNNPQHLLPTMAFYQPTPAGGKFPIGKVQVPIELWLEEINRIYRKVRQAQEIIYGLKTIFDYMLYVMLLYNVENDQFEASKTMRPKVPIVNSSLIIPFLPGIVQPILEPVRSLPNTPVKRNEKTEGRKKATDPGTSSKASDEAVQFHTPIAPTRSQSKALLLPQSAERWFNETTIWHRKVEKFTRDLDSWRMIPEECFEQEEPDPSMLYGLIHILRLFVKLPDILNQMRIPRRKIRIIAHHVNQMIEHIEACYAFSTKDLYFTTSAYEEDQIKVEAAKSDDVGTPEVKVEVDNDKTMYSTRNYRIATNLKAKPQLAKVVEVPLSNTDGSLEEHRLTVSTDTSIPLAETDNEVKEETAPVEPTKPITIEVEFENGDKIIKVEPISPSVERAKPKESVARIESSKKAASRKPVIPLSPKRRHVRESAANAVAKNAHIFASQQNFSSRSSYSSSGIKREPKEKATVSVKRKLSTEEPSSPSKRITRTVSKSSSNAGTTETKKMSQKQQATRSPRTSPDRSKVNTEANQLKRRRTSAGNAPDMKFQPPKKITSPRTSKSSSPHKVVGPVAKTPQKCTSSCTTAIRLRSKSGERQLRSKGSLVNALSLPMQTSQRSSKPSPQSQSPKRRQSLGSNYKDSHSPQSSSPPLKQTEPARKLRSRR